MAANVLNSQLAIEASVCVVRAFVKVREVLVTHKKLVQRLDEMEGKYNRQFQVEFDATELPQNRDRRANPELPRTVSSRFGAYTWAQSWLRNQFASTGTVMVSVLPFLVGFELVLQALVLEIRDTPREDRGDGRVLPAFDGVKLSPPRRRRGSGTEPGA